MPVVAIALGSNLGDRRAHLAWAVEQLAAHFSSLRVSSFIETDPVGVPDEQPPYLNGVVVGEAKLSPHALIHLLLRLEAERGRARSGWRAARTLDLDLVLYGNQVLREADLVVPHPRYRERAFVLEPLAEVAPEMLDPEVGKTVGQLWMLLKTKNAADSE